MTASASQRPRLDVAVVMERERAPNAWEDWRFRVAEVVPHEPAFGSEARLMVDDGRIARRLHPGLAVELFRDEAEGYHLNLTSGHPVWFVMWRQEPGDPPKAWPEAVSLSYNEAGRWLDAQERVDNLPLDPVIVQWLQAYTDEHYHPEPKKRQRPASFQTPGQREPYQGNAGPSQVSLTPTGGGLGAARPWGPSGGRRG